MGKHIYGAKIGTYDPAVRMHFKTVKVADKSDLSATLPLTFDQDGIGMCVGCAVAEHVCTKATQLGIIPAAKSLYLSPWYPYNGARKIEGTLNKDNGCDPVNAFNWILQNGVVSFDAWPALKDTSGKIPFDTTDPLTYAALAKLLKDETGVLLTLKADGEPYTDNGLLSADYKGGATKGDGEKAEARARLVSTGGSVQAMVALAADVASLEADGDIDGIFASIELKADSGE